MLNKLKGDLEVAWLIKSSLSTMFSVLIKYDEGYKRYKESE